MSVRRSRSRSAGAVPAPVRGALAPTIREATARDAGPLARLAQLDSSRPLEGRVIVAEVSGRLWAALSLSDDRAVADPFEPTAGYVSLLRERARQMPPSGRARRGVLAGRPATLRVPAEAAAGDLDRDAA